MVKVARGTWDRELFDHPSNTLLFSRLSNSNEWNLQIAIPVCTQMFVSVLLLNEKIKGLLFTFLQLIPEMTYIYETRCTKKHSSSTPRDMFFSQLFDWISFTASKHFRQPIFTHLSQLGFSILISRYNLFSILGVLDVFFILIQTLIEYTVSRQLSWIKLKGLSQVCNTIDWKVYLQYVIH